MNERINRLAILCTEECGDYHIGSNPQFNYDKFAELIVQECIDIIAPYTVRMSRPGEEYLHPM